MSEIKNSAEVVKTFALGALGLLITVIVFIIAGLTFPIWKPIQILTEKDKHEDE